MKLDQIKEDFKVVSEELKEKIKNEKTLLSENNDLVFHIQKLEEALTQEKQSENLIKELIQTIENQKNHISQKEIIIEEKNKEIFQKSQFIQELKKSIIF